MDISAGDNPNFIYVEELRLTPTQLDVLFDFLFAILIHNISESGSGNRRGKKSGCSDRYLRHHSKFIHQLIAMIVAAAWYIKINNRVLAISQILVDGVMNLFGDL
jgi:hypothetical protein